MINTSRKWDLGVKTWKLPEAPNHEMTLVSDLIGWESGACFLDQLQSELKQNQSNPE